MARWTKKLIAQQNEWTSECFKRVLLDVYGKSLSHEEKAMPCNELSIHLRLDLHEEIHTPETAALYLKYVLALDSEKLSLILEAFQKGKQYRKQETIDAIMTELFERSANSETKRRRRKQ